MDTERPPRRRHVCPCIGVLFAAASGAAVSAQVPKQATTPTVVSTEWLAAHRRDRNVVVLNVEREVRPLQERIPGAIAVAYLDLVEARDDLDTELPASGRVRTLLEADGVSDTSLVVVYSREVLVATRTLFTLTAIGLTHLALLDGGLSKWIRERRPITRTPAPSRPRARLALLPVNDVVVEATWARARLERPGISFVDSRTDAEYEGRGTRRVLSNAGHLPGAGQIQWEELFADSARLRLRPWPELRMLFAARTTSPGDTVVAYCWDGYRASAIWLVARLLGLPVRLYDASYQDWRRRGLPVRRGTRP